MRLLITILAVAPLMSACGSKGAAKAIARGLPTFEGPGPGGPAPAVSAGKNNGKDFGVVMAGIIKHPYAMGVYQVVIYDANVGSACYGIGDRYVKVPLDANNVIGVHHLRDNLVDAAIFSDGAREARVGQGTIEILTFDANGGTARIDVGAPGAADSLQADVVFERCF